MYVQSMYMKCITNLILDLALMLSEVSRSNESFPSRLAGRFMIYVS
jgi:hypothetical protein